MQKEFALYISILIESELCNFNRTQVINLVKYQSWFDDFRIKIIFFMGCIFEGANICKIVTVYNTN